MGRFIQETIESIRSQSYSHYEHIVVDGGSTDNTINLLSKYSDINLISEPDEGQSDAINKGFNYASGEILAWQNADDLYFPNTFECVVKFFESNPEIDLVYGNYCFIDERSEWISNAYARKWDSYLFSRGRFCPVQPTVFWRKEVWEKCGPLDLSLNYTMDVNFYSKVAKSGFKIARIDSFLGKFRSHDNSKTHNANNRRIHKTEYYDVLSSNFNFSTIDKLLFNYFYYRSQLASIVKMNLLKK